MSLIDGKTTRVLFTTLLFALGLVLVYAARRTLMAFLFAIFFAYLMAPLVSRLEKLLRGRGRAIALIYLLLVSGLALLFFSLGPHIGHQAQRLSQSLPSVLEQVSSGQIVYKFGIQNALSARSRELLQQFLASHRDEITEFAQRVGLRLADTVKEAWLLLVVPILAVFFLRDGQEFGRVLTSMVHARAQREFLEGVLSDLNRMLAHFIRAQITLAALSWLAYSAFLGLLRVPYAMMLGTVGGILEFIPVVGPLVAAVLIFAVSLLAGYPHYLLLIVFLALWRLLQDYVVAPRVMGERMELHPLAAIFGVLAGAEIAGVLGVYLSIPVMAALRIVFRRWQLYMEKRRFGPLNEYAFGSELRER
jgi:predicted PurR-regulated permease PerM